jgi:hypothetical protein
MGPMPSYRIHRLKDHLRQNFRFAPHVSGAASLKPRDYLTYLGPSSHPDMELQETVEAESPYSAYFSLRGSEKPLEVGDVLESLDTTELRVFKFVGFEEARWVLPEPKPEHIPESEEVPAAVQ